MKIYVWSEGVLTDYKDGLVIVLARNLREARKLAKTQAPSYPEQFDTHPPDVYPVTEPRVWSLYGSA